MKVHFSGVRPTLPVGRQVVPTFKGTPSPDSAQDMAERVIYGIFNIRKDDASKGSFLSTVTACAERTVAETRSQLAKGQKASDQSGFIGLQFCEKLLKLLRERDYPLFHPEMTDVDLSDVTKLTRDWAWRPKIKHIVGNVPMGVKLRRMYALLAYHLTAGEKGALNALDDLYAKPAPLALPAPKKKRPDTDGKKPTN